MFVRTQKLKHLTLWFSFRGGVEEEQEPGTREEGWMRKGTLQITLKRNRL